MPTTLKDLAQYRKRKKEAEALTRRLERLTKIPNSIVTDSVRGSAHQNPYQEHIITITGFGGAHKKTIARLDRRLEAHAAWMKNNIQAINDFIDRIECDEVSHILDCYYVRGMTWGETAKEVYGYATASAPRMAANRFFAQV